MTASNGQMPLDLHDRPIALRAHYESVRRAEKADSTRKSRTPPPRGGEPTNKIIGENVCDRDTPTPSPLTHGRNAGRVLAAGILGMAGFALAAIGAVATVTYSLETTGNLMAALAAAADAVALILPAAACALWTVRRRLLAAVAWCLWIAATGITAANVAGFIGQHTGAFLAGREVASTERTLVLERLGRLRAERAKISETRPTGAITVAIQNSRAAELETLRTALAMAKRRDAIDLELTGLETRVATLPTVSAIDPSASVLAEILRLPSEVDLRRIRLAILLLLPLTSGLLIAMALAIGARTEPSIAPG
jgi:hypothetical protein